MRLRANWASQDQGGGGVHTRERGVYCRVRLERVQEDAGEKRRDKAPRACERGGVWKRWRQGNKRKISGIES